jgi:hypothetical protein
VEFSYVVLLIAKECVHYLRCAFEIFLKLLPFKILKQLYSLSDMINFLITLLLPKIQT